MPLQSADFALKASWHLEVDGVHKIDLGLGWQIPSLWVLEVVRHASSTLVTRLAVSESSLLGGGTLQHPFVQAGIGV